jgi:hypothetical protein
VHEFFVTTATDILSINTINIDVPIHQHAVGSDVEPPDSVLAAVATGLTADSFITTPGTTVTAGGGFENAESAWFDTTNDGAAEDFLFARLTVQETGTFSGNISVRHDTNFVRLPFEFLLPGNEADMQLLAAEQTYAMDFPPTPPPVVVPPAPPELPPPALPEPPADPNAGPKYPTDPPEIYVIDPPTDPPATPEEPEAPPSDPPVAGEPKYTLPSDPKLIDLIYRWPRPDFGVIDIAEGWTILPGIEVFPVDIDVTFPIDLTLPGEMLYYSSAAGYDGDGVVLLGLASGARSPNNFTGTSGGLLSGRVASDASSSELVPEPSTALLSATALITLLAASRRRRN